MQQDGSCYPGAGVGCGDTFCKTCANAYTCTQCLQPEDTAASIASFGMLDLVSCACLSAS